MSDGLETWWIALDESGHVISVSPGRAVALAVMRDANGARVKPLVDRRAFLAEQKGVEAVVKRATKPRRAGYPSWDDPEWDCWRCGHRIPYKSYYYRVKEGVALCEDCHREMSE